MSTDRERNLRSIVNGSGFVFQLSIMDNIQRTKDKHGWEISAHEHPWRNQSNGNEGYIDIILKRLRGRECLVVECKRTKDASWIFLNPDNGHDEVTLSKCLWSDLRESQNAIAEDTKGTSRPVFNIISGWDDFAIEPRSPQSEFCAIRGSGENDKPLLERICGQLLKSIESLSIEEMEITSGHNPVNAACIYIPVVVTNTQLELCHFDPEKVSMSDGLLPNGNFKTVPFIRFRKSLTTIVSSSVKATNLTDASKEKERTILIINSNSLSDFLENFQLKLSHYVDTWPWRLYR